MVLMKLIAGTIGIISFGFFLVSAVLPRSSFIEKISSGFLAAIGIFTISIFLLNLAGLAYTLPNLSIVLIVLNIFAAFIFRLRVKFSPSGNFFTSVSRNWQTLDIPQKTLILIIAFILISALLKGIYWPVRAWDSIVLYDFRAKIFQQTGYMYEAIRRGYFFGYPLLTSLAHTWVYLLGGSTPLFIYSFLYISFVFLFYSTLREFTNRPIALVGTVVLALVPSTYSHASISYTNLPYTVYLIAGFLYLYRWYKTSKSGYALLAGVMTGLSAWSRSVEPFWLVNLVFAVFFSVRNRDFRGLGLYILSFFALQQPWRLFQSAMSNRAGTIEQIYYASRSFFTYQPSILKIKEVVAYIFNSTVTKWIYLFLAFLGFSVVGYKGNKKVDRHLFLFLFIIAHLATLAIGIYIFSISNPKWKEIPDSARRMSMFFPAMFIFFIFLRISEIYKLVSKRTAK